MINQQLATDINEVLEAVEASAEIFVSHTANKDNPHKVTKEQVGLGNVDNTSDMDKPLSRAAISSIETLKLETLSAINTFKEENSAEHIDIYSAIKTAKTDSLEELEKAVTVINGSIDSFYSQLNNTIHSLAESNSAAHTALVSSIDTTNRTINTVKVELQTAINNKAASNHNHDSTYSKINHTHTGYAASSHNHAFSAITGTIAITDSRVTGTLPISRVSGAAAKPTHYTTENAHWVETPLSDGKVRLEGFGMGNSPVMIKFPKKVLAHHSGLKITGGICCHAIFSGTINPTATFGTETEIAFSVNGGGFVEWYFSGILA